MKKSIALIGSPNCGKTSLFNLLTGLNHKVGNFPGITVDKKVGTWKGSHNSYSVFDLPGTYSLHPKSPEEQVVVDYLNTEDKSKLPDVALVVIDQTNLRRNLLLFSQVADLGLPIVAVLNMSDLAEKRGVKIDTEKFKALTGAEAVSINARKGENIDVLEQAVNQAIPTAINFCRNKQVYLETISKAADLQYQKEAHQVLKREVLDRYEIIDELLKQVLVKGEKKTLVDAFDKVLLHPCLLYTSPSPRDISGSRMPSSA